MKLAPFVQTGNGVHPTIDFESLARCYPDLPLDVWNISSASDLISWEIMRDRYEIKDPLAVPCDLFVWGIGEPPDGRLTRVGGVPWLPKKTPWPVVRGVVTTFLCQFDFRDSRDLKGQRAGGPLPGDLLLVFVTHEDAILAGDEQEMRFVWVSADETDVVTAADIPAPTHPFREFVATWGVRYRTYDAPTKWDQAFDIRDKQARGRSWSLPVLWGTKIGGVPYNSQQIQRKTPPNYLCQLTSIQASHIQWPWVNQEEPLSTDPRENSIYAGKNCLMIGDMGELTLFLHDDGTITTDSACG